MAVKFKLKVCLTPLPSTANLQPEFYINKKLVTYLSKCISRYFPKRLELSFFTVFAFPNDSKRGVASIIYGVHTKTTCKLNNGKKKINAVSAIFISQTCSVMRLPFASLTAARYCSRSLEHSVLPAPLSPLKK